MSVPATAKAARDLAGTWLQHLRRDARGLPVPWINRWGAETAAASHIRYDPLVGGLGQFFADHGDVPDFFAQNIGRQRQAMVEGRCQVCARPVPWSRRNLVISGVTCEDITIDDLGGEPATSVIEPWLDDRCAANATLLCPALIRRRHDEDLTLLPVRRPKDVLLVKSVGALDLAGLRASGQPEAEVERLAAEQGDGPIYLWVKAVLPNVEIVDRATTAAAVR